MKRKLFVFSFIFAFATLAFIPAKAAQLVVNITKTGGVFGLYGSVSITSEYDRENDILTQNIQCLHAGFQRCRIGGKSYSVLAPTGGTVFGTAIEAQIDNAITYSETQSSLGILTGSYVKKMLGIDPETNQQVLYVYNVTWNSLDTAGNGDVTVKVTTMEPSILGLN